MHDHAGLLNAIRDAPDDDGLRLILADWYDDNGDPDRAEHIRLQVRRAAREGSWLHRYLSRIDTRRTESEWAAFVREACRSDEDRPPQAIPPDAREAALEKAIRRRMRRVKGVSFGRGLPERWEVTAWDYLKHIDEVSRHTPVLSVGLTAFAPHEEDVLDRLGYADEDEAVEDLAAKLAAHPSLASWVELDFIGCPGDDFYLAIVGSPHLKRLRRLVATQNETGPAVAEVADVELPELRWLDLYNSNSAAGRPDDDAFISLVTCPHFAWLEYLNYGTNNAADEGTEALAGSPVMKRLRSLCLCGNYVGREGWAALGKSRTLESLRHLDLSWPMCEEKPGDEGLAALLKGPLGRRLSYLKIDSAGITDDGIRRLGRTKGVAGLRSLIVGGGEYTGGERHPVLTAASVPALGGSPHLKGLRRLSLPMVPAGDEEAAMLAAMPNLTELAIDGEGMTAAGNRLLQERFGDGLTLRR